MFKIRVIHAVMNSIQSLKTWRAICLPRVFEGERYTHLHPISTRTREDLCESGITSI